MVERLCVPLIHSTVERHLNFAASGASFSAACAPNSASTLTPLLTGLSFCAVAMDPSRAGSKGIKSIAMHEEGPIGKAKSPDSDGVSKTGGTAHLGAAVHDDFQPRSLRQPGRLVVAYAQLRPQHLRADIDRLTGDSGQRSGVAEDFHHVHRPIDRRQGLVDPQPADLAPGL